MIKSTQLFVLCIKNIRHHDQCAFQKGHVYLANYIKGIYEINSEQDANEPFPKSYFEGHFKIIFPVMENLK
jgi:hypothetical protein